MPLSDQEKTALKEQLATLLELNEPESILATLDRVAQRMAHSVTRGAITELEALRWQAVANACQAVEKELERANAPRQATIGELTSGDDAGVFTHKQDTQQAPQGAAGTPNAA